MTTQQIPAYSESPQSTKVLIGAGTAVKAGFFFALGVTLFSLIIWIILAVVGAIVGASLLPVIERLFQS